jgi:2-C-methyl-D-erythritol 2,4-cyclodiphosphate synthase
MVRFGWGYDIHALHDGRSTVLAGVEFPEFGRGFDTHSDGDVVVHAIIDALAGALAAGSLGDFFAEDDPDDQEASSIEFLDRFRAVLAEHHAVVVNLDCTIIARLPRIVPVARRMRENIARGLRLRVEQVSVKGKTNDGFGPEGRGDAISAVVVAAVEVDAAR